MKITKIVAVILVSFPFYALAKFDPNLVFMGEGNVDPSILDIFNDSNAQPPGEYNVDIYINKKLLDRETLYFYNLDDKLYPDLTYGQLEKFGVDINKLPKDIINSKIENIKKYIPEADVNLNFNQQSLYISIPQIYMQPDFNEKIEESKWDDGITAFFLNYQLSNNQTWYSGAGRSNSDSLYLGLDSGLNIGPWRLRSKGNYTQTSSSSTQKDWNFWNNYAKRSFNLIKSSIVIGQYMTRGDILDSIQFKGVSLQNENQMLPRNKRGFSPTIQGTAQTNATVQLMQNGNLIYQTNVPPGPFEITDLPDLAVSGNIIMTVKEDDGRSLVTTIPYSGLAIMQRPGTFDYQITMGKYDPSGKTHDTKKPEFFLGAISYGVNNVLTTYGGTLISNHYRSGVIGSGIALGFLGALSADITLSSVDSDKTRNIDSSTGQSYRFRYSKSMLETGTSFNLMAYRYSTKDYFSFDEYNSSPQYNPYSNYTREKRKNSFQILLNQSLNDYGNIYLSGNIDSYWNSRRKNKTVNLGYNNTFKGISYAINYSLGYMKNSDDSNWVRDQVFSTNITIPFNLFSNNTDDSLYKKMRFVSNVNYSTTDHKSTQSYGVSGYALDNNKLNYYVSQSHSNTNNQDNSLINVSYEGDVQNYNLGYSYNSQQSSFNSDIRGALIAHGNGVTLSKPIYNSAILVKADGVPGVTVIGNQDAETNSQGYAVVTNLSNYQKNQISLDPTSYPSNAVIKKNSKAVYPTDGAIVLAEFNAYKGYKSLMQITFKNKLIPFGAIVSSDINDINTIVGDNGTAYLVGLPERGTLSVKWGPNSQCIVNYDLTSYLTIEKDAPILKTKFECH